MDIKTAIVKLQPPFFCTFLIFVEVTRIITCSYRESKISNNSSKRKETSFSKVPMPTVADSFIVFTKIERTRTRTRIIVPIFFKVQTQMSDLSAEYLPMSTNCCHRNASVPSRAKADLVCFNQARKTQAQLYRARSQV